MRIYVANSFKRLDRTRALATELAAAGADEVSFSEPGDDKRGIDGCLARIDNADALLLGSDDGRIGASVALDVGYALARNKPVLALVPLIDPPIGHRVHVVADAAAAVAFIRTAVVGT